MSTFYLMLYIFIGIILLLCLISFGMYCCHVIKNNKAGTDYDEERLYQHGSRAAAPDDSVLNQTDTTQLVDDEDRGSAHNASKMNTRISDRQPRNSGVKVEQIQLLNVKKKAQMYEQEHDLHKTPSQAPPVSAHVPLAHSSKPPLPMKPLMHSQPPSARNSIVRPSEPPPPPPLYSDAAVVPQKKTPIKHKTSFKKPNAPPPPPPNNDNNSIYENVSKVRTTSNADCSPPTYDDAKDIPAVNFLSDS